MKKTFYPLLLIIAFIAIIFTAGGCLEDEVMEDLVVIEEEPGPEPLCPRVITPDTFFLTDQTIAKFPYDLEGTTDSMYFLDSVGNSILAVLAQKPKFSIGRRYNNTVTCVYDTAQEVNVVGKYEVLGTPILINELGLRFSLGYRTWQDLERYPERIFRETGGIYVTSQLDNDDPYFLRPIPQIVFILNDDSWPNSITGSSFPTAEATLNGRTFYDVYFSSTGQEKFQLYYNFEFGLIGFKDERDGILYALAE